MIVTTLLHIDAPHFCAGVILNRFGLVIDAAPILRYMLGWHRTRVEVYVHAKRWSCTTL